ncbi:MAG TPA: SLC13 family permease [Opitutaceae bacterium]|jgi:Na+/H+ antiporter NhaD/arsenite permease-like protein|nr:SLC13 family permease [Opitutaceae bacterium]
MNVPFDARPIVLAIFVLTYLGLAIGRIPGLRLNRTGIALLGAIGMMIFSRVPAAQTAASINWPTILLLFGFFVLSAQLRLSGFYDRIAAGISARLGSPNSFLAFLIVVTAALSAFLNNDIVVCVLTPVVATALVRQRIDPVPYLVALAAASNIGAAATLIGNAQNMMVGSVANLGFLSYMAWAVVPVLVGLAGTYAVALMARSDKPPILLPEDVLPEPIPVPFNRYHCIKGLVILGAVIAFFFTSIPREITVLVAAGIHLLSTKFKTDQILALVEWPILLLFMSLFVVSGSFQATGYAAHVVQWMGQVGFDPAKPVNEALLTTGLTILINNAPAVMLLIKIVPMTHAANAYVLAVANSFAGNAIVTASIANIIVVQEARQQGIAISFVHFAKLGIPIMLISIGGLIAWAALVAG